MRATSGQSQASKSELATVERQTRERFRMSDPVIAIRNAATLTETIHEELRRLPSDQREMFMSASYAASTARNLRVCRYCSPVKPRT